LAILTDLTIWTIRTILLLLHKQLTAKLKLVSTSLVIYHFKHSKVFFRIRLQYWHLTLHIVLRYKIFFWHSIKLNCLLHQLIKSPIKTNLICWRHFCYASLDPTKDQMVGRFRSRYFFEFTSLLILLFKQQLEEKTVFFFHFNIL
jgi:hypothetical protein